MQTSFTEVFALLKLVLVIQESCKPFQIAVVRFLAFLDYHLKFILAILPPFSPILRSITRSFSEPINFMARFGFCLSSLSICDHTCVGKIYSCNVQAVFSWRNAGCD